MDQSVKVGDYVRIIMGKSHETPKDWINKIVKITNINKNCIYPYEFDNNGEKDCCLVHNEFIKTTLDEILIYKLKN